MDSGGIAEIKPNVLTAPPSPAQRKAALAMAQVVREMTLARLSGIPFSDVSEDLRRLK